MSTSPSCTGARLSTPYAGWPSGHLGSRMMAGARGDNCVAVWWLLGKCGHTLAHSGARVNWVCV